MSVRGACYIDNGLLGFHMTFVTIFFALACYIVLCRFSAHTPTHPSHEKLKRNKVYKVCGTIMVLCCVAIGIIKFSNSDRSIFWPETIVMATFAAAWLVKGQTDAGGCSLNHHGC